MGWFSAIVGGGLGAMIAGPFGAIIGAALGAGVGSGRKAISVTGPGGFSETNRKQMIFFTAAFSMVGKLSKADGRVCKDEIAAIERISRETLGLDTPTRQFAVNVFTQAKDSPEPFGSFARQFGEVFGRDAQMCSFMLSFLFEVAMADGVLHQEEERMLREAKSAFHLGEDIYQALHARYVGHRHSGSFGLEKQYEILGVTAEADDAAVKKAYRQKCAEFHPDKIAGKGLPPEFIKFANDRLAEINAAYAAVKKARPRL